MIQELISRVFCTRNCAHLQHWSTASYAEHSALGEFYDQVIPLIDHFVECFQGNFGRIPEVKLKVYSSDVLKCLEDDVVWMAENREKVSGDVSSLENSLDEIVSLYLKTIYKLKNLK